MHSNIGGKLLDKTRERIRQDKAYRSDLYLADYQMVNKSSAKVLVGYHLDLKAPLVQDVARFIVDASEGKIAPVIQSATNHPKEGGMSIMVEPFLPRRPIGDAEGMMRITASMYTDEEHVIWDVVKSGEKQYLARRSGASLTEVLQKIKGPKGRKALGFHHVKSAMVVINEGDTVRFYANDRLQVGTVVGLEGERIRVKPRTGDTLSISHEAVMEISSRGNKSESTEQDILLDYFTKAIGEEYARKLVNREKVDTPVGQ